MKMKILGISIVYVEFSATVCQPVVVSDITLQWLTRHAKSHQG